jgi:hypothetical protein
VAVPLGPLDPTHRVGVGGCEQFSAGDAAKVVGEHIVVLNPIANAVNAIEEFDQLDGLNDEAGLFPHLAGDAGSEGLAYFKQASGERPLATQRLCAATHEEDAAGIDDYGSDANQRRFRIFSLHDSPRVANTFTIMR